MLSLNINNPQHLKAVLWNLLIIMGVFYSAFDAPLSVAMNTGMEDFHLWIDGAITVIFAADIFFHIKHKFVLADLLEMDKKKKKKDYLKSSSFPLDLIATFPFDLVIHALNLSLSSQWLAIFRLARLIRIAKLKVVFDVYSFLPKSIRISLLTVSIGTIIHWITCGWLLVTPQKPEISNIDQYIHALYWCMTTLTTVGYGDVTPQNNLGKLYANFTMILGVGAFGVIIGNLSRILMLNDKNKEEKKEKLNNLHTFLKQYDIPSNVQSEVFSFYYHLLEKKTSENDDKVLADLPHALQEELRIYMKMKMIRNLEVFEGATFQCLKAVAQKLDQKFFSPGSVVVKQGDDGAEMYVIAHGNVEIVIGGKVISTLKAGQCFGEMALIDNAKRSADVTSQDYCDLYIFHQHDYEEITALYPELKQKFWLIYQKRKNAMKKAA